MSKRANELLSMNVETGQDVTDWKESDCPFERLKA